MARSIGFIGGGNMATSIIGGLISAGAVAAENIVVAEPDAARREQLRQRFGIEVSADNARAVATDTVILAVKPQVMRAVVLEIAAAHERSRPLLISVAAGVREPDIRRWLGGEARIVRSMPNTPALLGCGAVGLFANRQVSAEDREWAQAVMSACGITEWVNEEAMLDVVTALSGSGPAYFFALMEWMTEAAVSMGMDKEMATRLATQTCLGAARMAVEGDDSPATLRENVTSPQGTTQRALETFIAGGAGDLVKSALTAARDRAVELGDEFGA